MEKLTLSLELPQDLPAILDLPEQNIEKRVRELIAIELFREGLISSGKGGEIVGVSKWDFIQLLAKYDLPYFSETSEELTAEVTLLDQIFDEKER